MTFAVTSGKNSARRVIGRPFKKGQSGNPSGRPKQSQPIKEAIQADYEKHGHNVIERLRTERLDLYLAYGFGKPTENISLMDSDGTPLAAIIQHAQNYRANGSRD